MPPFEQRDQLKSKLYNLEHTRTATVPESFQKDVITRVLDKTKVRVSNKTV
jgi:hypothetical protein